MTSTVYIAKNVYGGDGLGRLGDGRVIFVPGAFAGESVKAEIVEEKKHFVKARLVEIVEASPDRIASPFGPNTQTSQHPNTTSTSSLFSSFPGMVYANLSFAGENKVKESQLKDAFERARLPLGEFSGADAAGEPLHYRNKVVYHFAKKGDKWLLGYRMEPSHEILDVTEDPLARPEINAKLPEIRRSVMTLLTTGPVAIRKDVERKGNVTIRWTAQTGVKWWLGDAPKDLVLKEMTCGRVFDVPADGFYQVNPEIGDRLVKSVIDVFEARRAESDEVLDLYCGVGVFGLCMKPAKLTGIESGRQAIEFAKRNAAALKSSGRFFADQVGRSLRKIKVSDRTTIVVDPPRGGMEPNVPKWLAACGAPRIIYVSCDPATLVRDLKTIVSGYDIESVRWFNMFPRTARFETMVVLKRK